MNNENTKLLIFVRSVGSFFVNLLLRPFKFGAPKQSICLLVCNFSSTLVLFQQFEQIVSLQRTNLTFVAKTISCCQFVGVGGSRYLYGNVMMLLCTYLREGKEEKCRTEE